VDEMDLYNAIAATIVGLSLSVNCELTSRLDKVLKHQRSPLTLHYITESHLVYSNYNIK